MVGPCSRRDLIAGLGVAVSSCVGNTAPSEAPEPPAHVRSEWPAPDADAGRSNANPAALGPTARPADVWERETDAPATTPVIADETVFVGTRDGSVHAFDAVSGAESWHASVGTMARAPWVTDESLVVPTATEIVALRQGDGTEVWRVETAHRAAVLVASHGIYWIDDRDVAVVALAVETGAQRWRTQISDPWEPTLFASETAVFVSSGTSDQRMWQVDAAEGEIVGQEPRAGGADFPAEQFYQDGHVYAVDPFFGTLHSTAIMETEVGWAEGVSPASDARGGLVTGGADRVYYAANAADAPGLYALRKSNGSIAWVGDVAATITGRPVSAAAVVLVPTDGGLQCYDSDSGEHRWTHADLPRRFAVVDDLLYVGGEGGVRALRAPG